MKKVTYAALLFLFMTSIAQAAETKKENMRRGTSLSAIGHPVSTHSFSAFFTEDFSGGLPSGWTAVDSAGNGVNWHYTTTGAFNGMDSLSHAGTSAADGYMIFDSDSTGGPVGGENADLISDTIDCSAHPNVHLIFNEFLTHYNDTATVWVSNDGTNWTMVHNSSAGLGQYVSTPNPNVVDIDISSVAGNSSTVYLRFNYRADYSFFWMIDDIQLYESPAIEASIVAINAPITSCVLLTGSETVMVDIFNSGGDTITTGLSATYVIDGGTPVTESVPGPISPGSSTSFIFSATTDISLPGPHTVTCYISLAGDTVGNNDTITVSIYNGPRPVNLSTSYTNGFETATDLEGLATEDLNGDSYTWEIGTLFPNSGSQYMQVTSVTANDWLFTSCLDMLGSIVYKISYRYRTSSTSSQARYSVNYGPGQSSGTMTEIFPLTLISNFGYTTASHQFNPTVDGAYYIGFQVANGDSAITGFYLDDISIVPDSGVGISQPEISGMNIFPNPSEGVVYISFDNTKAKNYTVNVFSPTGKEVMTKNVTGLESYRVDLSDQPAGIYLVKVSNDDGIFTRRITIY